METQESDSKVFYNIIKKDTEQLKPIKHKLYPLIDNFLQILMMWHMNLQVTLRNLRLPLQIINLIVNTIEDACAMQAP